MNSVLSIAANLFSKAAEELPRVEIPQPLGTTIYLYDGSNDIEEIDNSGSVLARYTQGRRIDQTLAELRSGTISFYQQDALSSVTSLSISSGDLANTYTFDSFGQLTAHSGTLINPFQYTGRESDSESGFYYYRARYFDASAGRFLSEDPIYFSAGTNFYRYAKNVPTRFTDPSGLSERDVEVIINNINNIINSMNSKQGTHRQCDS